MPKAVWTMFPCFPTQSLYQQQRCREGILECSFPCSPFTVSLSLPTNSASPTSLSCSLLHTTKFAVKSCSTDGASFVHIHASGAEDWWCDSQLYAVMSVTTNEIKSTALCADQMVSDFQRPSDCRSQWEMQVLNTSVGGSGPKTVGRIWGKERQIGYCSV